ncbi:MAG: universal stress protein [Candidatus Heimdallarchaeum endolithica]|uniref:Universal stress protein n=1 Tax=Candidatus Heimdallarchaeum endolithica TaxID=2876572 RepID=A0A9Y1BR32_9ARCH|nr:MAG: universal stress protein [Candidatus Heimdallarchaeum endolithica]
MSDKARTLRKIKPDFQDEFFITLNKILLPLGGKSFEKTAMDVAFYIAHEYGAKLDIIHVGRALNSFIDNYLAKLNKYKINYDLTYIKNKQIAKAVIEYWNRHKYRLVIMAARRKPSFFDKIIVNSVSNQVIKNIEAEILQVFPPKLEKLATKMKKIAILLPYSNRDPFLLRWASAIAAPQKNATINVYHVNIVPEVIPLDQAVNEKEIKKENLEFEKYVNQYEEIFGRILKTKIVLGHDVFSTLEYIFEKDEPDLVIIGRTKNESFLSFLSRPLSCKIRDKLLNPSVVIHHMKES